MKYHIITYGCQMNEADSERIAARLEKNHKKSRGLEGADLIVVNMCSIRKPAVDRVYGLIEKFKKIRKTRKIKTVLTGCILKRDLLKFRREFDEILEQDNKFKNFPEYCPKDTASIPISTGCNNSCSYCVVPHTRGKLKCRDHKEIIKEIKKSVRIGVKKIWLLGQNVNDYRSPSDKSVSFPELLKLADKIDGDFKIFFTSPHPKNFSDGLIKTLADSNHFSGYLNLPVQSGDDIILKRMNRPYTVKKYKDLVRKIRKAMPDINLSTDVIIGFPGETRKQFKNTEKLFKELNFNIAYINKYSPREGTASFKLKDDVPFKEKKRREQILIKIANHG
ncbi:MAG: MiaB/RimO family radical SAM methylthiotransferase [Candidatus Paceibacterota bacterium]|jgi:tRNA-2-methylthio-N6-dimethylallyladenosine synthase